MNRARRRRWPARLAWVALAAGAVVLLGAVLLPRLIDVNTYRSLIQTRAEQALGRPVSLGEMSLSVFPSIAIRVDNPEIPGLMRARALRVGVRLLPLLRGAVELRHVVLQQPEVTLARRADGTWDLGAPPSTGAAAPPPPAGTPAPAEPARFSLARLVVDQGLVRLTLHTPAGEPVREDLSVDLEGSVEGEGMARLSGSFEGVVRSGQMHLQAEGTFARSERETRAEISLDEAAVPLDWARRMAQAAGMSWPVPEGMLQDESLRASGRMAARVAAGEPSRFELRGVRLEGAAVTLARDTRGAWNVAALLQGPAGTDAREPAPPAEIFVEDLRVEGARLRLQDAAIAPPGGKAVDLAWENVDLHVRSLSPGRPLDAELSASMTGGGSLRLDGRMPSSTAGAADVDVRVTLEGIRIGPVAPYLLSLGGVGARSGEVGAKLDLSGSWPSRVRAEGTINLQDVVLAGSEREIDASADFDLAALEQGARTEIARLRARSGGSQVEVSGWIDNREGATRVDLNIPPAAVQARDLMDILAVAGIGVPVEFASGKPVQIEARVRGDLSPVRRLDLSGRLTVADATLRHASMTEPMRAVNGTVMLRGNGFEVSDFSAAIGGSDVAGNLSVEGFDAPRATFQLRSKRADFMELLSFLRSESAAPAAGKAPASGTPAAPPGGPGMFDALTARGTLAIEEGSFETLDFSNLSTTMSLERRVVRLDPVEMTLYGGAVSGWARMDLRQDPPVYAVSTQMRGVDTDALLADNLDMKGALTGALSGQVSVSSTGRSQEEALRNATGGGDVKLERGRVGPINVLGILSKASDVLGERSLERISGKLAREGTDFSTLTASLKTSEGEILTDNLHLVSPDLELKDDGSLHMLKGTIEIAGEILLSSEISQAMREEKSRAAEYFWDARMDRVNLPLTLSGPVSAPQPSIDWRTASGNLARRRIEERLRDKLGGKRLEGLFGGRGEKPPESASPPAGSRPTPPAEGVQPAGGSSGAPTIAIDEKRFAGNLLLPELKIKGTLRGTGLAAASITVKNEKGDVLHEESLEAKIRSFYATTDRAVPAVIPFRMTLESRKMMGLRDDVVVTITVQDDQGRTAESTFRVER